MSRDIPITEIAPDPDQPRQHFAGVEELAASLDQQGQAVPIAVRPVPGSYRIIHGERRYRAARSLGWDTIEATVKDVSEEEARWLSLVENVQRADLTPVEEARAYQRQIEAHDLTQTALAERIGKSQSYVAQKLRLLRLPPPVSFWIERGALTEGHVRQIIRLKGIYPEGATMTLNADALATGDVASTFFHLRPLAEPVATLHAEGEPTPGLLAEAIQRLREHAQEAVPSWHVAAWWFAGVSYRDDVPVTTLKDALDNFRELLLSAAFWFIRDAPREIVDTEHARRLQGHLDDLECAGITMNDQDGFAGDFHAGVIRWVAERVEREKGPLLPSTMQGGRALA